MGRRKAEHSGPTVAQVENVARRFIAKLFGEACTMTMKIERDKEGAQMLRCAWASDGWDGQLTLRRGRELTAKELAAVMTVISMDEEETEEDDE